MITIGELFELPKVELFPDFSEVRLYQTCRKREVEIKKTVGFALRSFNVYVEELEKKRDHLPKWKKEWMKSCMTCLGKYLDYLINELDKVKIEEYCKLEDKMGENFIAFMPDLVLLMINSFQGAIETDLHWIPDLTLSDSIDISIGDFDFNKLAAYLPKRIDEIKDLLQNLEGVSYVDSHSDSVKEAIVCFGCEHRRASNVLLITIIEGLVRSHGVYLTEKQNLKVNPLDKQKYSSLDSFLMKIPWKKDLTIDEIRYGLLTGDHSLQKSSTKDVIMINLTERLGFLCRRFKENRNMILHGEDTQYASVLNSFLNFSALKEILLTIKEYKNIYN